MNCHGTNNQDQHENGHKGHSLHMILMVLCCALPVIALLLLPALKIDIPLIKNLLPYAAVLLCPLMHIMMIPMMLKKDKKDNSGNETAKITD